MPVSRKQPEQAAMKAVASLLISFAILMGFLLLTGCQAQSVQLRVATFNVSLTRHQPGQMLRDLQKGDANARKVAAIIQSVRPDILFLNEVDDDGAGQVLETFHRDYLGQPQFGQQAIQYPHRYTFPSNTGIETGFDLDRDGSTTGPTDAQGFGNHPGQYAFALLSRYPIDETKIRQFQKLLWRELPNPAWPDDPATPQPGDWYSDQVKGVLRLSSKNHVDVPVQVHGRTIHLLLSHPTPPVFDGPEDRNGRRNFDEIRFWSDYIASRATYADPTGGLPDDAAFIVMGDMNADPFDGGGDPAAIRQLLEHPRVNASVVPSSRGAVYDAKRLRGANEKHQGPHEQDTGRFPPNVGQLRVDYVLPSRTSWMKPRDAGVFWPAPAEAQSALPDASSEGNLRDWITGSDHCLVWMDLAIQHAGKCGTRNWHALFR